MKWFNPLWFINAVTFFGIGDIISGGASILGGIMGSDAASSGKDAQVAAANDSAQVQRDQYNQTRTDTAPYRNTGQAANDLLAEYLGIGGGSGAIQGDAGFTPQTYDQWAKGQQANFIPGNPNINVPYTVNGIRYNDIGDTSQDAYAQYLSANPYRAPVQANTGQHDPNVYGSLMRDFSQNDLNKDVVYNNGLNFGLNEGIKGIDRLAAAHGGLDSGSYLKSLSRYANDYATTKASDAYNRFTANKDQKYNMLNGVAQRGVQATGLQAGVGAQTANNISSALEGAGNAQAAGAIGSANAWSGALGGLAKQFGNSSVFNPQPQAASGGYSTVGGTPWYLQ